VPPDLAGVDHADEARPPLVSAGAREVTDALAAGRIIAVPGFGGYSLAVRAGSPDGEARLVELAADPDGPHYAVGHADAVRALTSGWTDELGRLLERCWPGPVEVFLPWVDAPADGPDAAGGGRGVWAAVVGMPDGRVLRRLCREQGPWRTVPLSFSAPGEVTQGFDRSDVALVVDGGRRDGAPATLVDATVSPIRVLREGALPASFIEGTMLMNTRRRLFSRTKKSGPG
jgi:L-threonylcarbamoyladenylate synthase